MKIQIIKRNGFTLAETIIALFIAALAISFFLTAFAPATVGINQASRVEEAKSFVSALEAEMNIVRDSETSIYASAFDKAFKWVRLSEADANNTILAFKYRADASLQNDVNGLLPAFTGDLTENAAVATNMILQNRVTLASNVMSGDDMSRFQQIEGSAFLIKLVQLQRSIDGLTEISDTTQILNEDDTPATSVDDYTSAALLFRVELHRLKANDINLLSNTSTYSDITDGKPLYSTQIGVLR